MGRGGRPGCHRMIVDSLTCSGTVKMNEKNFRCLMWGKLKCIILFLQRIFILPRIFFSELLLCLRLHVDKINILLMTEIDIIIYFS